MWEFSLFKGRHFISLLTLLVFVLSVTVSCTTSNSDENDGLDDETSTEETAEGGSGAEEDTATASNEKEDSDKSGDKADDDEADNDKEDDEFLAEDANSPKESGSDLGEKDLQNEMQKNEEAPVVAAQEPPPPPNNPPPELPPPVSTMDVEDANHPKVGAVDSTQPNSAVSDDGFEVVNPPIPQEDLGVSDPLVAEVDPPLPSVKAAQEIVPLAKINKDPFFRNERLMNTVYVARPSEDLAIISQKIYNEDKTSQLLADNPHLSKGVETGDKIYYNSPHRPDDKKSVLTYYEDNKMTPQYYMTRKGDDIKKIGREILGNDDGWKEIWSTNEALQTQAMLPSGLKVRYWSGSEPKSPPESSSEVASQPMISANTSEPPPPAAATTETLPELPPAPTETSVAGEDPGMPSSNLPAESLSAMPPSPQEAATVSPPAAEDDSLMTVAAIAMIAMAGIAIVAIQIKNRKKAPSGIPPSLEFTKV